MVYLVFFSFIVSITYGKFTFLSSDVILDKLVIFGYETTAIILNNNKLITHAQCTPTWSID